MLASFHNSADLERSNKKGLTALQLSVRSGHLAVAEELLRRGARPNVVTKAGLCLRCLAQSEGHNYLTVRFLTGASVACTCINDRLACDSSKHDVHGHSVFTYSTGGGSLPSSCRR